MNEETLLTLLSRLTGQLVEHFDEKNRLGRREEFAKRVAEAAWEGLVFMLRQSLANEGVVVLKDVGTFRRDKSGGVLFEPAASLVQAAGISTPAKEAYPVQGRWALFYLHEGSELLRCIPYDVPLLVEAEAGQESPSGESVQARLLKFFASFGQETPTTLSARARSTLNVLDSQVRRLEGESPPTPSEVPVAAEGAAEAAPPAATTARWITLEDAAMEYYEEGPDDERTEDERG